MKIFIILFVCFFSSVAGSICGIGGGVMIKPTLDAAHMMDVASVSFLSGCTVLSMSAVSLYKNLKNKDNSDFHKMFASILTVGSILGGIIGKSVFQLLLDISEIRSKAGAIQAAVLLLLTAGTMAYELKKETITTKNIENKLVVFFIGCILGILSAFLGIGGGPINLIALFYLFSMRTKEAALYSIYSILFSQIASLLYSICTGNVPPFSVGILALMIGCGITGGLTGSAISRKMNHKMVDQLFTGLMVLMIFINLYNIFRWL